MLNGCPADFADLYLLFAGILFVEYLYIISLANRTLAAAMGILIPNSFASVVLGHLFPLILFFGFFLLLCFLFRVAFRIQFIINQFQNNQLCGVAFPHSEF